MDDFITNFILSITSQIKIARLKNQKTFTISFPNLDLDDETIEGIINKALMAKDFEISLKQNIAYNMGSPSISLWTINLK